MATLSLTNPVVGGSEDTWGTTLNTNFTNISNFIGSLDSAELAVLDGITATTAELNKLDGFTGVVADFNVIAGGAAAGVTSTEFQYLNGVTSAIQTQLNNKEPIDAEILRADTDDNLTAGYTYTADNDGTKISGTYTPTPAGGNIKTITCNGSFSIAAPSASGDYTLIIQVTNGPSAGTISLSGFDKTYNEGDFTSTNGHVFNVYITKIGSIKTATVEACQ